MRLAHSMSLALSVVLRGPGGDIKDAEDAAHGYYFCLLPLLARGVSHGAALHFAAAPLAWLECCSLAAISLGLLLFAIACALSSAMRVRLLRLSLRSSYDACASLDAKTRRYKYNSLRSRGERTTSPRRRLYPRVRPHSAKKRPGISHGFARVLQVASPVFKSFGCSRPRSRRICGNCLIHSHGCFRHPLRSSARLCEPPPRAVHSTMQRLLLASLVAAAAAAAPRRVAVTGAGARRASSRSEAC